VGSTRAAAASDETVLITLAMTGTIARTMDEHVVIVGAGPAGLAAAWAIRRAGLHPLVVDQADAVAASWRGRHDHLRLNTHRAFSHQPGARIPRNCGPYPARDDYVAYLRDYSAGMRLRLGTRVHRIDRTDGGWVLALDAGSLTTAHAVIATGSDAEPVLPSWPGLESFGGTVMHAGRFRNVAEFAGRDVLVVGPGNSGVDLLGYLAGSNTGRLWLSARSGMTVTPRRLGGVPLHRSASRCGAFRCAGRMSRPAPCSGSRSATLAGSVTRGPLGPFTRQRTDGVTIAVDDGFARALKAGRVVMKPGIDRFDGPLVRFTDGTNCAPDAVICATGYRSGIEALAGHLVALDRRGMPPFIGAESSPEHPGLWFFGLDSSIYGNMHVRRRQARQLARAVAPLPAD
jgi:putative flavoprotein involved in K+ transport